MRLTRHAAVIVFLLQVLTAMAAADPLTVSAEPVYLNPEAIHQTEVGKLRFVSGLRLSSDDRRFGGLSGHTILGDGLSWLAVSDEGFWFAGNLRFDETGAVRGLADVTVAALNGTDGVPLPRTSDKRFIDAEALREDRSGDLLVSFEGDHRILRYSKASGLSGPGLLMSPPKAIKRGPGNGGLEAIATLPDGRILALTEDMRDREGRIVGWIVGKQWKQLRLAPTGLYKPTDLFALPSGHVLLLERRYTRAGGPGARLSVIAKSQIAADTVLRPRELAQLVPPMSVDNFEGLAVRPDGKRGWYVYLLSDDNFNPLQRTLLLQFQLPAAALSR